MKSKSPSSHDTTAVKQKIPALVSIHDVMPATLEKVDRIIDILEKQRIQTATLLVVPGKAWQAAQIDKLRSYSRRGYELAGHGWHHRVEKFGGISHRLHGLLISKKVAEHLALDTSGIAELIERCYGWFKEHDLPAPGLYVPPAWAMGRISELQLQRLPFRYYEYFGGIYDSETAVFERMPLVGYEADAWFRAPFVSLWNRVNFFGAQRRRRLRFSIHPNDFELYLQNHISRDLRRVAPAML